MKKIYDIKEFAILPPPYGGVSIYVKRLIEHLEADGYKVGGFYGNSVENQNAKKSSLYDKWEWMPTHLLLFKVWTYLKIVRPYKIIHSHFSLEGMAYLWFIKKLGGKRIIVTIHNSMVSTYYANTNVVNRFFLEKMLRSKDICWITVSEQGKQQLLSLPVKPVTKVHVLPAYIPITDECYTSLNENMLEYIKKHDKNIAFYGHSFMQNNGIDVYGFKTIINVYSEIVKHSDNKIGLVLCLSDSSDIVKIEELHRYAIDFNVNDNIYWQIGAIDNIRTLWKNVDMYIRPTSTDGDSVAVREALDEGTIVIASDVCTRPQGVITYNFGDNDNLYVKIMSNINHLKSKREPDFIYYKRMKDIYDCVLNQNKYYVK